MSIIEKDGEILPAYYPDGNGNQPRYPGPSARDTEIPHDEFLPELSTGINTNLPSKEISPQVSSQLPDADEARIGLDAIAKIRRAQGLLPPKKRR